MDVSIDRSKPNPLRRFLVWFAGFLLTGRVANDYTLTTVRNVSAARVAFSLGNLGVVGVALYYLFVVVPTEYTILLLAIPVYWVGLRGVLVGGINVVASILERVQYVKRDYYSS